MKLSEEEIKKIAAEKIIALGNKATPETLKEEVIKIVQEKEKDTAPPPAEDTQYDRFILIAAGMNRTNVTAKITGSLGDAGCNILDITQKMMDDFFTLSILVDMSASRKKLDQIKKDMEVISEELGIKIYIQHEKFFH